MLALYSADGHYLAKVESTLAASEPIVSTDRWGQFEQVMPKAACSVAVVKWLRRDLAFARLSSLKARFPLQPLVLVTSKDADNARALKDISVEEVVWLSEIERSLTPAVRRANASGLLRRVAETFERSSQLPRVLREALAYACRADEPIHSLAELAVAVARDRRTLWRQWHGLLGAASPLRLEDVLDWLILMRAAGRKVPHRSWTVIAAELHTHQHTLARSAARLAGLTLRDFAGADQSTIAAHFVSHVLQPLVGERGWDVLGHNGTGRGPARALTGL